jgi:hypothetical protein
MNQTNNVLKNHPCRPLCIGLAFSVLFLILCSVRLTEQGLYHDEVHQALPSFAYLSRQVTPEMLCMLDIKGIPILNMSYSGAIKTGIYGLYLKYFGERFTVASWRALGILFVSAAIFFFSALTAQRLPSRWLLLFLALFISDMSVILTTRFDWGPTALALALRLIFIALWMRGLTDETMKPQTAFLLGAVVSFAAFEKLSSVVLVFPLALAFAFAPNAKTVKHGLACLLGLIVGGVPLIFVNAYTWIEKRALISLQTTGARQAKSLYGLLGYYYDYLATGNGAVAKSFILGPQANHSYVDLELFALTGILLLVLFINSQYRKITLFRVSTAMMFSYLIIPIGLYLLPPATWLHHWMIGTPFHYAAVALTFTGLYQTEIKNRGIRYARIIFVALIAILLASRISGVVSLEQAFLRGDATKSWDSSFSKIGYFAATHTEDSVFIAAEWGVATQIFCLSNGYPDVVYQLYAYYEGQGQIQKIMDKTGKQVIYLVEKIPHSNVTPQITSRLIRDIETLPDFRETVVESEIRDLKAVRVRKFVSTERQDSIADQSGASNSPSAVEKALNPIQTQDIAP